MSNLVFIHGSGGNRAVWAFQSQYFSRHHQVLALNLPGHGLSQDKPRASIAEYADYVRTAITRKDLAAPIVVGHSLGGAIALRLALDSPPMIGALALVGTGARLRVLPAFFEAISRNFDQALDLIGDYAFSPAAPGELVAKALFEMKRAGPELVLKDFRTSDGFDVMGQIGNIRLPTLVVVGRDDRMTPLKYAEYLRDHIPGAKLEVIEQAGHMVMIEQPQAFNEVLARFVSEVG